MAAVDSNNNSNNDEALTPDEILNKYKNYHMEMPYQIGLGKIYDPIRVWAEKERDYFAKEYELKATGVGNRVFSRELLEKCKRLGELGYNPSHIDPFSEKYLMCDPGFQGSHFGVVIVEVVDGIIRVLYAEEFFRKDGQAMIDKILDLRVIYRNIKNILVDASQSQFIMDIKMYFDNNSEEYPREFNEKIREWQRVMGREPWEMGMYIIPCPFNKRIELTQRLKKAMETGIFWVHPSFDKLIISFDTSVSKSLDVNDIDKEHVEYNDILDALLALFRRIKVI